jgi:enoyl-CoA hydratase/carnithine racemase
MALQLGTMYTPEEALGIRLVDQLAEPENLIDKAEQQMKKWLKIPG